VILEDTLIRASLVIACFIVLDSPASPAQTIKLPKGKAIMLDAKISPGEWDDASHVELFSGGKLHAKRAGEYVYVAIHFPEGAAMSVDLYVDDGTQPVTDLHASAQVGERVPRLEGWSNDDWHWANNREWVANVNRIASWQDRKFRDENVREFQIRRSRFPGKNWRVMLDVMTRRADGQWTTTSFPANANSLKPDDRWLTLNLGD
jgi:hypothetical protein